MSLLSNETKSLNMRLERFHPLYRFKVLGYCVVHAGNHLVNGFFPRRIQIFLILDGFKKLAKSRLDHEAKTVWYLKKKQNLIDHKLSINKNRAFLFETYFDLIISIVVRVERSKKFTIHVHVYLVGTFDTFA